MYSKHSKSIGILPNTIADEKTPSMFSNDEVHTCVLRSLLTLKLRKYIRYIKEVPYFYFA